jgi:hypothetical protein
MFHYKCWEKLDHLPEDHWRNKNRRFWTAAEHAQLLLENGWTGRINLGKNDILCRLIDRNDQSTLYTKKFNPWEKDYLLCGRVINFGNKAFPKRTNPNGSLLTLNDFAVFDYDCGQMLDYFSKKFYIVKEKDLLGVIENPYLTIESNSEQKLHNEEKDEME